MISKKLSHIMIFVGAALVLAACALMIYNKIDDNMAGRRSQQLLEQMMEQMFEESLILPENNSTDFPQQASPSQKPAGQPNHSSENHDEDSMGADTDDAEVITDEDESSADVNTASKPKQAPAYSTLGVLQIPAINLKLPIIDGWTDARGNIAPCSIAGSANFKPRRLIIAGHNLKSHFKSLIDLNVGDEVLFTGKDGVTYRYSVIEVGQCHRDNPEVVSSGEGWDITLVTCKTIRTMRTLIRCAEIIEEEPDAA